MVDIIWNSILANQINDKNAGLIALYQSLFGHINIIVNMTRRNVLGRYRGSALGILWSFLNPLLMLAVYTLVFSVVFKVKWGDHGQTKVEFAGLLFAGMIVHGFLSECIGAAPATIVGNKQYVKKILFPLSTMAWTTVFSALIHTMISLLILLLFVLITGTQLHWTILLVPVVLLPLLLLAAGLIWFISSLAVYFRDVAQVVGLLTTVLLFVSPIFYPVSALPEFIQKYIYLNPLTLVIEELRNVMIWGKIPDLQALGFYYLIAIAVCFIGFTWFQKTRKGFADVV